MLFNIPPTLPAELLHVLARMGHGDEIAIVDSNFPSFSTAANLQHQHAIEIPGQDLPSVLADIASLLPLDTFDDAPVCVMQSPGGTPSVHRDAEKALANVPGGPWSLTPIERFAFYERANNCMALVRTLERRPYGCVILKAGVIGPNGELMTPALAAAAD